MKKEKVERFPVPEGMADRFVGIVYSMVEAFGVDKIPDVMHHVELLGRAVERHSLASPRAGEVPDRTNSERRRFIAIYKNRHLLGTDMEYARSITPVEGKLMGQVIDMMKDKGFDVDEYLQWVFEVFLVDNPKFSPPTIKLVCSQFVTERFMFENKDRLKSRKQEELVRAEAEAVVNRARVLIRAMRAGGDQDGLAAIVELLKKYRDGHIMLDELRRYVEVSEKGGNAEGGGDGAEAK
jgi:hypothetical protein